MFNTNEIEVLLEALDSWESAPGSSGFTHGLLGMMLGGKDKSKDDITNEFEETMDKQKEEGNRRKEIAVLIKAKLITERDRITVEEAKEFMTA